MGAATYPDGSFIINRVPPGSYMLSIHMIGFHIEEKDHVLVSVGKITEINAVLRVNKTPRL